MVSNSLKVNMRTKGMQYLSIKRARAIATYNITRVSSDLSFPLLGGPSSSEKRKTKSSGSSESLRDPESSMNWKVEPDDCLRFFLDGVSEVLLTRKALDIEAAQNGTPIALFRVDRAVRLGSCSTSTEESGLL
jgi:hypothetical protein